MSYTVADNVGLSSLDLPWLPSIFAKSREIPQEIEYVCSSPRSSTLVPIEIAYVLYTRK